MNAVRRREDDVLHDAYWAVGVQVEDACVGGQSVPALGACTKK